ncbi:hypothetical protein RTP6_004619 [Batrachochytrium dendrobatidis]
MRLSSIFYLLGLALTTVSAETACTGIYCGCELGYCWKANSAVNPTSFRVDRFCERTEDCLKGCVDGYCQVTVSFLATNLFDFSNTIVLINYTNRNANHVLMGLCLFSSTLHFVGFLSNRSCDY